MTRTPTSSELEVIANLKGVELVDTTTEDAQNQGDKFLAILQLLILVNALIGTKDSEDSRNAASDTTGSGARKVFDFLDAITNLMVMNSEVVAAVASAGGPLPTRGIISYEIPSDENAQPQPPQSAHMESLLSSDIDPDEDSCSIGPAYLKVSTVANSTLDRNLPSQSEFKLSSGYGTQSLWPDIKGKDVKDVFLWTLKNIPSLDDHMRILESYLNEYKSSSLGDRRKFSNHMLKYIIGSCIHKMNRRAFAWYSIYMIGSLTWMGSISVLDFQSDVTAKPDTKLSRFLLTVIDDNSDSNKETIGEWLVNFHPSKDRENLASSLKTFLHLASGSEYPFDKPMCHIFFDLLLCSLYAYLTFMKRIYSYINKDSRELGCARKYIGKFSNAIRILYYVTHSNAMKACFTHGRFPSLTSQPDLFVRETIRKQVNVVISNNYIKQKWTVEEDTDMEDMEDKEGEEFFNLDGESSGSLYRKLLMSFVDHLASLHLLERRSITLPSGEPIKLSLINVKHSSERRYFPWKEMEKVIHDTCQDQGQVMIDKIKSHLKKRKSSSDSVIKNFNTLLAHHGGKGLPPTINYPLFFASFHCESSLAAILYQLHTTSSSQLSDLRQIFQITDTEGINYKYNISVSKFCCPVCWELIQVLNETNNNNLEFAVRAHHSNLHPVRLPHWLPDRAQEAMIERFGKRLYEKLCQLPSVPGPGSFGLGGHARNDSVESAADSVSSVGSTDTDTAQEDGSMDWE